MPVLLPTAYFPPIAWFKPVQSGTLVLEAMEYFPKQTIRNRCYILDRDRMHMLIIPLAGRRDKTLTKDIKLDHSQPWQRTHLRSLQACYRRSPWFEFFEDDLEKLFSVRHAYLIDWNETAIQLILKWMNSEGTFSRSTEYEFPFHGSDLRSAFIDAAGIPPYALGAGRNIKADSRISILDLLFWEGNKSREWLAMFREL